MASPPCRTDPDFVLGKVYPMSAPLRGSAYSGVVAETNFRTFDDASERLRTEAKTCSKQRLKEIYQQIADEIMAEIAKLEPCKDNTTFP